MTIRVIFQFGSETIEVRIQETNVYFRTTQLVQFATIDGLKLDKSGVIKEFPDLKDKDDWKEQAIKRFKEKIKNMSSETERAKYVIEDLSKFGYKPLYIQKAGHRPIKL